MHKPVSIIFVLAFLLLSACASGGNLLVTPTPPIIAYESTQIDKTTVKVNLATMKEIGQTGLKDVPLLNMSRSLKNYRPNRAYAIGYPDECGGSWHSWSYQSEEFAAKAALKGCLHYVKGREKHVGKKCGARLVLVNKKLLANPEDLPNRHSVPFVMETSSTESQETIIYGMFEYEGPGENLSMTLFNDSGKKICDGRYTLTVMQAAIGSGAFELDCFEGKLQAQGELSLKRIRLKNKRGTENSQIKAGCRF